MNFRDDYLKRQANPDDPSAVAHKIYAQFNSLSQRFVRVNSLDEIADQSGALGGCCVYRPVPTAMLGSEVVTESGTPGAITYDGTVGPLFTLDILTASPEWLEMSDGLTTTQKQTINKIMVCPNGAIYAGRRARGANAFLAYAPSAGAAWTIIEDSTSLVAKLGGPSTDIGITDFNYNGDEPEEVVYIAAHYGSSAHLYIGAAGSYAAGATYGIEGVEGSISYGDGNWLAIAEQAGATVKKVILAADASSVVSSATQFSYLYSDHLRGGTSGETFHFGGGADLYLGHANLTSYDTATSPGNGGIQAVDPTATQLFGYHSASGAKQSDDGGLTFALVTSLPVKAYYGFDWIDGEGAASRWLCVSNNIVYISSDFGATWTTRFGNLADFGADLALTIIKVIPGQQQRSCLTDEIEALVISPAVPDPLSVHITGGLYMSLDGLALAATTDPDISLAAHIPGLNALIVGIQSDNATGVFSVVDGSGFSFAHRPTTADLPAATDGNTMLFYVRLFAGQTEICPNDLITPVAAPVDLTKLKMATQIHAADEITELSADDELGVWNSLTDLLAKISFENLLAQITTALTTVFDALYAALDHTHPSTTRWEPLANGDPASPALVFTPDGDVIMVEVTI